MPVGHLKFECPTGGGNPGQPEVKPINQTSRPGGYEGRKEKDMYRVFRVLRDEHGTIVHKTPVGCSRTERGARALIAGQWGECIIEKLQ